MVDARLNKLHFRQWSQLGGPLLIALMLLGGCASTPPERTPSSPPVSASDPASSEADRSTPATGKDTASAQSPAPEVTNTATLALLEKSVAHQQRGEVPQAIALVERAIRLESNRGDLWIELAHLHYLAGDLMRAKQLSLKGIALADRSTDSITARRGWLLLADVVEAQGDTKQAHEIRNRWATGLG